MPPFLLQTLECSLSKDETKLNKATYLDCSDLPALPGLILSGLLAFFPSPMKWEKSSVCCSRYSNRFSAPAEPEVPAPPA